jgi:hypothetical protein
MSFLAGKAYRRELSISQSGNMQRGREPASHENVLALDEVCLDVKLVLSHSYGRICVPDQIIVLIELEH